MHGAIDRGDPDVDRGRRVARQRDRPAAAAALPLDHTIDQVADVDALNRLFGARVGREIDELGDEITQLGELDLSGVDQLHALRLVERPGALQQLDVRA